MKLSQTTRAIAAIIMLFSLLFAQLAVSAHACPVADQGRVAVPMASMPDCTGMGVDKASPALCAAHCDTGHQSADISDAPVVQPFMPGCLEVVLPQIEQSHPLLASSRVSLPLNRATAPPLAIRHCCFRI